MLAAAPAQATGCRARTFEMGAIEDSQYRFIERIRITSAGGMSCRSAGRFAHRFDVGYFSGTRRQYRTYTLAWESRRFRCRIRDGIVGRGSDFLYASCRRGDAHVSWYGDRDIV